jgi:hypothetical protein
LLTALARDTATALAGLAALALIPQPLDLLSQPTELTADRFVFVFVFVFVLLLIVTLFLSFSPFVYFLLELIEALSQLVDLLPQLAFFRFVALVIVVRLVSPSPQSFQIASEHSQFAPDLLLGRTIIFLRHWTVLLPDRQRHYRYRRWLDCMCG